MPAVRASSSELRRSKASQPHSTAGRCPSKSSSSNGPKRFACPAWWCDSTFGRRADMAKHIKAEHFGTRSHCTICDVVMKQDSNLSTHLNGHLSNHCTICSCGQGFTDPSAYTRHRETFGHAKGVTHGKPRDAIIKGVKVQHVAGLQLNVDLISDPSFIPPHFDVSYHFKGVPKPKGQEKYNPVDYIELAETTPTVPSVQMASSAGGAPIEYDVSGPPAPVQTEIRVEELGINTNYSYDVELPQETHPDQVPNGNVYAECHDPQTPYPEHKFTQPIANWHHTGANWYPYGYQENHAVAIDHHFTHPSQQTTGPHVQPGYQDMHSLSQVSHHAPWSMPSPQYNFFEEMGVPKHVFYPPLY